MSKHIGTERPVHRFINTGLQPGVARGRLAANRFNGLPVDTKAVETALIRDAPCTGLKPGVNEKTASIHASTI